MSKVNGLPANGLVKALVQVEAPNSIEEIRAVDKTAKNVVFRNSSNMIFFVDILKLLSEAFKFDSKGGAFRSCPLSQALFLPIML